VERVEFTMWKHSSTASITILTALFVTTEAGTGMKPIRGTGASARKSIRSRPTRQKAVTTAARRGYHHQSCFHVPNLPLHLEVRMSLRIGDVFAEHEADRYTLHARY